MTDLQLAWIDLLLLPVTALLLLVAALGGLYWRRWRETRT